MKRMLIRYKTKPERTVENEALIKAVFAELHASAPEGLRYMSLKLADGRDRCIEPPQSAEVTIVGNYRMLAGHESLASA